jgi:hypothetical protein
MVAGGSRLYMADNLAKRTRNTHSGNWKTHRSHDAAAFLKKQPQYHVYTDQP